MVLTRMADRAGMLIKLPLDHMRRLDKAARYCGQTKQAFVQAAVLAEIAEVEENQRAKRLRATRFSDTLRNDRDDEDDDGGLSSPRGMGIAEGVRTHRGGEDEDPSPPAAAAPVVVNVGGASSSSAVGASGDVVDALAAYVAEVRDFERGARLRQAVGILAAKASSPEERAALAKRLDDAVAARTNAKGKDEGVLKTARRAFDKVAGIFNGGGDK